MATIKQIQLGSTTYDLLSRGPFYGTCSTAAGTNPKVVSCSDFTSADLVAGAMIVVKNTTANTGAVTAIQLNVNSTGAKNVKKIYNGALSDLSATGEFGAYTMTFVYDGSYWVLQNTDYNTTTGVPSAGTNVPNAVSASGATGTSSAYARADHTHGISVAQGTTNGYITVAGQAVQVKGWGTAATATYDTVINKNAFSKITVGSTTVEADAVQDTVTFVGGNSLTITPDATNDKVTFGISWPGTYTPTAHSHAWSNITNPPGSYTPTSHTHDYSKVTASASITTGTTIGTITVNNNGTNTTTTLKAWQPDTNFKTVLDSTSSSFDNLLDAGVATADDYILPLIEDSSTSGRGVAWFSSSEFDVGVIKSLAVPTANTTNYYLRGDLSWATITAGTDDKVAQNTTTTSGAYPLLASTQAGRSSWADGTRGSFVNAQFCVNPSNAKVTVGGLTVGIYTGSGSGYLLYNETDGNFYAGLQYNRLGTASTTGIAALMLGNSTLSGTVGNASGQLSIYGTNAYCANIISAEQSANRTYTIPNVGANADFVMTAGDQSITGVKTVSNRIVGKYTTTINTTTSVQANNIFSGTPTAAGVDNQIAFVVV